MKPTEELFMEPSEFYILLFELFVIERVAHEEGNINYEELDKRIAEESKELLNEIREMDHEEFVHCVELVTRKLLVGIGV